MNSGDRRVWLTAALVVVAAAMTPARAAADTVRIGAILSLTGNTAAQGLSLRDGLLLAADEINKRGGINGNRIEIVVEDSRSDPAAAVEAFNRMEASRPPLFYLAFLSSVGVALGPLADQKKVVLVGLVSSAKALTDGRQWVYRYWPLSAGDTPPLMRILQDLKVRKLGIIHSNEEYGNEEASLISRAFGDAGGTVTVQSIELADTDFHRQIEALKGQEAILLATLGDSLTSAVHQLRSAGYGGAILMPSSGANPSFFTLPDFQNIYLAAPITYNPGYLYAREAANKFTARYKTPFNHWAASGYDFLAMISGLLEDRPLTRAAVGQALASGFEYSGVFGPVSVRPGERDLSFPMYPAQISGNTIKFR